MEEQDKDNGDISSEGVQHIIDLDGAFVHQREEVNGAFVHQREGVNGAFVHQREEVNAQNQNTKVKNFINDFLSDLKKGNFIMDEKNIEEAFINTLKFCDQQEQIYQNKLETSNDSRIKTIKSKHNNEKKELEEKISQRDNEINKQKEQYSILCHTLTSHYKEVLDLSKNYINKFKLQDDKNEQLEKDIKQLNNENEQLKKEINKLKKINDYLRKNNKSSINKKKNKEPRKMEKNIFMNHFNRFWGIFKTSEHALEPFKTDDDQNNETIENNLEDSQTRCEKESEVNDNQHQQTRLNEYIPRTIISQPNNKTLILNIFSVNYEFFDPIEEFFTEVKNKEKYFLKIEKEINGLSNHGDVIKLNIDKDKEYKNNEYAALVIYCTGSRVEFSLYTQVIEDLKKMFNKRMIIFKLVGGNDSNQFLIPGDHLQVVLKASVFKKIYYNDDNIETIKSLCKSIDNKKL